MRISAFFISALFLFNNLFAQFGYYISRSETLPDTNILLDSYKFPVSLNREDVRAIGMGKAQIALGRTFNAMMYNPALLSRTKYNIEGFSLNLSMPPQTYEAANFLKDHISEFKKALSLKEIWNGVEDLKTAQNAQDIQGMLNALQRIQDGLRFPHDLLNKVAGSSSEPMTHGVRIIPAIAVQMGNFGFSLYGISQSGFQMQQSPIIDALLAVHIPKDVNNQEEITQAILSLEGPLQTVIDVMGNVSPEVFPIVYAVSFLDIVGAAGYGFTITPNLSIGANLKIIHRRFTTKRIVVDNYNNLFTEIRKDLNSYITGVTLDLGGLYRFPTGTAVGLSLQNIIPVQKITSHLKATQAVQFYNYDRDRNGKIILNQQKDTALVNYSINVNVDFPFDLKLPFVANIGVTQQITRDFDVAFDLVDVLEQEKLYDKYSERLRIGAEYRLDAIERSLGIVGRIGFADNHPTYGLGLNLFRVVQIDGAYAWDSFVNDFSYYAQLRIGW
jgi:hypothetical protein